VGTRKASALGHGAVEALFDGMPDADWTMVSGMADGIDATAHRLAAERGVPTVACLAHGLQGVHPRTNMRLAHHILDRGGCWVSEYRWGTPPSKYTFPARNRIIAGLVEALVVVESGDPGGSLITARLAQDYDRLVFALSPTWCAQAMKGNARLIRDQVAELLHAPDDLPHALGWQQGQKSSEWSVTIPELEGRFEPLLQALDPYRARTFDEVVERLSEGPHVARKLLLEAELEGWARCWPGDRYTRTLK
jgi:DNA processing protein